MVEEGETMKPQAIQNDSASYGTCWKFAIIALILICLLGSLSLAADEQVPKAVRRASPEGVSTPKGQKRVALVIGNNEYKEAPLRNPTHDAEDIANVLRGLGFIVQTKINADQREMDEAVREFVREIQNGDVGLFYFSGHGVQVRGENYLIPVGSPIESETDVRYRAVNAGLILGKMEESRNRTNIFILDACRNNPFKGYRSLSKGLTMMDAPVGTFIAYATAPGSVAADGTDRNSPYAKHLMQAVKSKGVPIEQVFKQVLRSVEKETVGKQIPWISSSLREDFYFNQDDNSAPVSGPVVALPPNPARPNEAPLPTSVGPAPTHISSPFRARAEQLVALVSTRGDASAKEELDRMYKDQEAVKWFRQAGEEGDDLAQLMLGRMFGSGLEVPVDRREALKWYRMAANQGNTTAQNNLGAMYNGGVGVAKDQAEAVKWFKKAAEQGNALAQCNLGRMYANGSGVAKDYDEAVKWYKKAVEQGNVEAQRNLGWMYREGLGVPKDYTEALKWYKKAVEQGNALAQNGLGWMYERGLGVSKDEAEAAKWYRKSAEQSLADGQNNLGRLYQQGMGVAKDYDEALKWYKKAAEQGNAWGQTNVGVMFANGWGVAKDYGEAVKWYKKAAEQGNATAQNNLGGKYRDGLGVPKDHAEALKWFRKAADQGDAMAQTNLGIMYQNGWGVAKDYDEAVKWYKKAVEKGNAWGQNNLGVMYQKGLGIPKDPGEAIKWYKKAADQGHEGAKKVLAAIEKEGLSNEKERDEAAKARDNVRSQLKHIADFRENEKRQMKGKYGMVVGNIEKGNVGLGGGASQTTAMNNAMSLCKKHGSGCEELYSIGIHNKTSHKIRIYLYHPLETKFDKSNSLWTWSWGPGDDKSLAVDNHVLFVPKAFYLYAEFEDGSRSWNRNRISQFNYDVRNNRDGQNLKITLTLGK